MDKSKGLKQHLETIDKGWKIDEVFSSIQTEGPFAGHPALFIRLFGCNLNCGFCDTPQDVRWTIYSDMQLKNDLVKHHPKLVVITGGEPYLQNIAPLCDILLDFGCMVQIETAGTLDVPNMQYIHPLLFVVVSPKTKELAPQVSEEALAFKYVIKAGKVSQVDGLPEGVARCTDPNRVIVSPCWEAKWKDTKKNVEEAVAVAKHFQYKFTLQYHKMIGIR